MGLALLWGMRLAQRRQFRAHGLCQTAVMLLNLVMIAVIMLPSFSQQVSPNLGKVAADRYYALPAIHAALGTIAELLGLFVVLVASGVQVVPRTWRFTNYRAWMRTTLALWWVVIAFGVGTYGVWYLGQNAVAVAKTPAAPAAVTVTIQNFDFDPKELTIPVGTTVTWIDAGGRHSIETADSFLHSDTLVAEGTYSKRFDTPGVYTVYCGFHGAKDGSGMSSRITVTAR